MNTQPRATTNAHHVPAHRHQVRNDLSEQLSHQSSYNAYLTQQRDLDRYRTVYSSKLNIFDNSRTVSPTNYFGRAYIDAIDPTQLFSPAGMDMVNSRVQTGQAFTKPAPRIFQQAL
jgi:hypothetical protein